jgi:hypothetical protein
MALGRREGVPILAVHRPGFPPERREIGAPAAAGGSHADDLLLPGWPPSALRLSPCASGVVAEAVAAGIRVGGRPVHPGGRRLLRAGERAELLGIALSLEAAPSADATRVAAGALVRDAAAGAVPITGPHLVVLSGPTAGARHPLGAEQTVGRGRGATITIPDAQASRVHLRIRVASGGATVEDLGSKNGVRVNGIRIERRRCAVDAADEIVIGETAIALHDLDGPGSSERASGRGRRTGLSAAPHLLAAALLALSAAALALAAR